jgi:hypothetical protein
MLAIIALLFLLLPFLLLTTSIQRLAGLELGLAAAGEIAPTAVGAIEAVDLFVQGDAVVVRAAIRTTDVTANEGDTRALEIRIEPLNDSLDLAALQAALRRFKALDPDQERAVVHPEGDTETARIVALLDATRHDSSGPLFSDIVLAPLQPNAPEPERGDGEVP